MDIYLWGPRGAGKTWLLNSLIRHINLIEVALRKDKSPFDLWMEDVLDHRAVRTELDPAATIDIDYVSYTLKRRYRIDENNKSKNAELTQLACTHDHQISMLDGPGDETTGAILKEANTEENRAKVLAANTRLKSAKHLIVAINGGIEGNEKKRPAQNTAGKNFSDALQRLINLDRDITQKVYLCFTKIDQYQGTAATGSAMLPILFGKHASKIDAQLRDLVQLRHIDELPAYFVSAPGYYNDFDGKLKPNFENDALADETSWRPYKVCDPFFDIFNDGEKEVILNMPIDPEFSSWIPKSLRNIVGGKLVEAHRKDVLGAHVSYHNMIDPSKIRT